MINSVANLRYNFAIPKLVGYFFCNLIKILTIFKRIYCLPYYFCNNSAVTNSNYSNNSHKMIVKKLNHIESFLAKDKTILKEVLHPAKDKIDLPYSIAHAYLPSGEKSLWHTLDNTEVYIILKGKGIIFIGDEQKDVEKGDVIVVPPLARQSVSNIGEEILEFFCIVSPEWSADKEEIFES